MQPGCWRQLSPCLAVWSWTRSPWFLLFHQKVVICVDWKKMYVKMLWKSIKHYPDSRLLLVISLITPGVFWAWENTFHFSCFPSSQRRQQGTLSHHVMYEFLWGTEAGWVVCSWSSSQKLTPRCGHSGVSRPRGEGSSQMIHWCSGDCWVSLIKLGPAPTYFPKRILPMLLLES